MNKVKVTDELDACKIAVIQNERLSKHTSFKIGGEAAFFAEPDSINQIIEIRKIAKDNKTEYFTIGNGTNLLVSDDGIDGIVSHIGKELSSISLSDDNTICCEAGASLTQLCQFARDNSLTGLEFAYGIPGSVGGAIYMNAGAYGGEIKDVLLKVTYIDGNDELITQDADELDLGYRHSVFSDNDKIIVKGYFKLQKGDKSKISETMDDILERRKSKQPLNYPSAGSMFKRPEGAFASALIDECGLKGLNVGDAYVSEKHAGFVVNKGDATSKDVISLVNQVIDIVFEKTGYKLEMEVKTLGKL